MDGWLGGWIPVIAVILMIRMIQEHSSVLPLGPAFSLREGTIRLKLYELSRPRLEDQGTCKCLSINMYQLYQPSIFGMCPSLTHHKGDKLSPAGKVLFIHTAAQHPGLKR